MMTVARLRDREAEQEGGEAAESQEQTDGERTGRGWPRTAAARSLETARRGDDGAGIGVLRHPCGVAAGRERRGRGGAIGHGSTLMATL